MKIINLPNYFHRIACLMLLCLSLSCNREEQEENRTYQSLPPFEEVILESVFHVFLIQDTVYSLKIIADPHFIDQVSHRIEDNKLVLNANTKGMWLRPENNSIKVYIAADRLKKVQMEETCLIETINPIITEEFGLVIGNKLGMADLELNNNIFYFWNNFPSGGRLTLRGNARDIRIWNYALMTVDASELNAAIAHVENHSKGFCKVAVTELLRYAIYGGGNIYLYGDPEKIIIEEVKSEGKLIQIK